MNALEIIVLVFAVLTILKAITLFFVKEKPITKMINTVLKYTTVYSIVLVVGIAAFIYFLATQMSVIEMMAGVVLGAGMMGLFFVQFPKSMKVVYKDMFKNKMKLFIGFVFFLVLSVWVILQLFVF